MNNEPDTHQPDQQVSAAASPSNANLSRAEEIQEKRRKLKRQQQEMRAERSQQAVEPETPPQDKSWTQVPSRYAGTHRYPSGTQEHIRNSAGSHQVRTGGHLRGGPRQVDEDSRHLALPLPEYILFAREKNEEALELAKEWQGPAFTFTRYMKSHPDLKELSSVDAAERIGAVLCQMYPNTDCPWSQLLGCSDSLGHEHDAFDHFVQCWKKVESPMGESPTEQAVRLADKNPVELPKYSAPHWKPYLRFISICRWLQAVQKGESIFIPVRKFGELIGKPPSSLSNYRQQAVDDGLLTLVRKHQGRNKATEFRFNFENLPEGNLEETAEDWGEIE